MLVLKYYFLAYFGSCVKTTNESLLVLFSPFSILLNILLLKCLLLNLLPQPNYSVDKENFKNKLRWSHEFKGRWLFWNANCSLIYISRCKSIVLKSRIIKLLNNSPFDFFGMAAKRLSRTPCLFAAISKQVKHMLWVHMECHANVTQQLWQGIPGCNSRDEIWCDSRCDFH